MSSNIDQVEYWNEGAGPVWAALQEALDRQLSPLGDAAMSALAPRRGETIVDIGCGCGQTSWALAAAVGPTGKVVGVDISTPMLAVARVRAEGPVAPSFLQLDAGCDDLGTSPFDAAYSRFGVMFFEDPADAFANIRRNLRAGGRLAFVCWRSPSENPMFTAPAEAAAQFLAPPEPTDPLAPGPFAFADASRVRAILAEVGFSGIAVEGFDSAIGGADLDGATNLALQVGPLARSLREQPALSHVIVPAIRERLKNYLNKGRVMFPAAVWIVTARA